MRGGKYIIYEAGKNRYLTDDEIAEAKKKTANKNVFYNINILADQ